MATDDLDDWLKSEELAGWMARFADFDRRYWAAAGHYDEVSKRTGVLSDESRAAWGALDELSREGDALDKAFDAAKPPAYKQHEFDLAASVARRKGRLHDGGEGRH